MLRREFLLAGGAIALSGCSPNANLSVLGLAGAIPSRSLRSFEQKHFRVDYKIEASPADLWRRLQNPELPAGVVSLGDSWLDMAIAKKLIIPFNPTLLAQVSRWQKLSPQWQALVTRNGEVWGIPYRWGVTAIAYRQDKVKPPITSWADLWQPELKRKITAIADANEILGLVLKKLGHSYHTPQIANLPNFLSALNSLHRQILTYSNDAYLQPLLIDDALVAVGWSVDLVRLARQNPNIQVVIPQEGTALWADLWVLPQHSKTQLNSALTWINATLNDDTSAEIAALTDANSVIASPTLPASVRGDRIKFPADTILSKSEFISNLSAEQVQERLQIWQNLPSFPIGQAS